MGCAASRSAAAAAPAATACCRRGVGAIARAVLLLALGAALPWPWQAQAADAALRIVAAENFYGDVATQLAGPDAHVTSILSNPNADPHLFEAAPATARALASANLVIYNGLGYDPWVNRLLASTAVRGRRVLEVAALVHARQGANPHLWYDPPVMPAVARAVARQLQQLDPGHQIQYQQRLQRFLRSLQLFEARVSVLRQRYAGLTVTATEPLPAYLVAALGMHMANQRFQLAVMNNTEPGARQVAEFERSLRTRSVRVLMFNRQTVGPAVRRLLRIAGEAHVPVVGMTETEPPGLDYQRWMLGQLEQLNQALSRATP